MSDYLPVPWVFKEIFMEAINDDAEAKIFYFCESENICEANGKVKQLKEVPGEGEYLFLKPDDKVRIDRIITFKGKPGPAFDEYDAYANACLDCTGGYDL